MKEETSITNVNTKKKNINILWQKYDIKSLVKICFLLCVICILKLLLYLKFHHHVWKPAKHHENCIAFKKDISQHIKKAKKSTTWMHFNVSGPNSLLVRYVAFNLFKKIRRRSDKSIFFFSGGRLNTDHMETIKQLFFQKTCVLSICQTTSMWHTQKQALNLYIRRHKNRMT